MVPSKLNSSPPYAGSLKLSVFVTLKTSMISSACPWRPVLMGRDSRTSQEKNALSLRRVFRVSTLPSAQFRSAGDEIGRAHLNSSHSQISYAVFCLKKKKKI